MIVKINDVLQYSNDLTILYVEDNKAVRDEMSELLKEFFQKIIIAKNGVEGLETYIEYKNEFNKYPDLIITDIAMPEGNGVEMSKKMLALNEDQIIIINSAHNQSELLVELINMGISFFLLKPVEEQHFLQTLY